MRKTRQMLLLEDRYGKPIEELMTAAINEHGSADEAARSLGVHIKTFWGWMLRLRIQVKKVAVVV